MKIERYDAVPRERNAAAAAAAARNLSELVRETCEREVQKIKKEVGAAQCPLTLPMVGALLSV